MKDIKTIREEVGAAIVKAVPEIMERKFGFGIRVLSNSSLGDKIFKKFGQRKFWLGGEGLKYYCSRGWIEFDVVWELERKGSLELLGRPITLEDVLRAIGRKGSPMLNFKLIGNHLRLSYAEALEWWDLEEPFEKQDDYCTRFLHSILV